MVITEASSSSNTGNVNQWLISIMRGNGEHGQKTRIQKVPPMLREIQANKTCYDPSVVAIGPYHHGKPQLELAEKLKTTTARQFVSESGKDITVFYKRVAEVAGDARKCYAEGSTDNFDDIAFTKMMFLDGCFILYLIDFTVNKKPNHMKMKCHDIAFVLRDLFLLENQIPFLVLKALMSLRYQGEEGKHNMDEFINQQASAPDCRPEQTVDIDPLHLLQLLRTKILGHPRNPGPKCSPGKDWHSFRSVTELSAVGINCKRSKTCCLRDVEFKSGIYGTLSLPPITIDDSTKSKLLNLIALETCPDAPDDSAVTSYVWFMDGLIDRAEDVKELRSKCILLNFLGSDEQVADLFNQVSTDLVPDAHAYEIVKGEIEKHYNNTCRSWMAKMYNTNFRTPWAVIGLFGSMSYDGCTTIAWQSDASGILNQSNVSNKTWEVTYTIPSAYWEQSGSTQHLLGLPPCKCDKPDVSERTAEMFDTME
ncbi:hypothetical protein HHK36_017206 [Tetracentron sinense]|uniref:Uncharacterized protein n=1 Tax=Tetracentron sinense TaxID=13715 RepID=A0A834YZ32_TETSI|nr:hypothetical protein HHK36_017206 [Tetracentron sinense]